MKNLPLGIQTLSEIRAKNAIYVDKTPYIYDLVTKGKYYFLSRPRRFGKSLLISTLRSLYLAEKELFIDTWIYDKWNWLQKKPVIHLSFDTVDYEKKGLEDALINELDTCAARYEVVLEKNGLKAKFRHLITLLYKKYGKVALLIDEYDKPIIDYLETSKIGEAKANRLVMRSFYSVLKSADDMLEIVFITGVSKFAQASIFSHLNNLEDITIDEKYATLVGYTEKDLENNFGDYLDECAKKMNLSKRELLQKMKIRYNGYSWDGINCVYNPFGVLNFLAKKQFRNYWFSTGNPNFLVEQVKKQAFFRLENLEVNSLIFEQYDIENLALVPLLFQTGYLTIKELNIMNGDVILDYPNEEVRESFYQILIDDIAYNTQRTNTGRTIQDIYKAFINHDLRQVRLILNSILADLPTQTFEKQTEGLYHGLLHIIFNYLGMFMQSEVHSSWGRADIVIETSSYVYVFEFKFNKTAQAAINQIERQKYMQKYQASGKIIVAIGCNFNSTERQIDDWLTQTLNH